VVYCFWACRLFWVVRPLLQTDYKLWVAGKKICIFALVSLSCSSYQLVIAQDTPPDIPDPSKLEDQFDTRKLPQSKAIIHIPEDAESILQPENDVRFRLTEVSIEGATVFSNRELITFFDEYINTEISISRALDIAARMTAFYRNEGYILSRVVVPAQAIENGVLTLVVVEGYIGSVTIDGDISSGKRLLSRLGDKITASRPLKANVLERYILLANDLPGVTARAVLQAAQEPGATDLTIVVTQNKARQFLSVNNRGSRFNGPVQAQVGAEFNSLLGGHNKTGLRLVGATQLSEFKLAEIRHDHHFGAEGTHMSLVARYSKSQPGASLADLDIESTSASGQVSIIHPVIRSRAKSLFVRGGVRLRNTETDVLGTHYTEDRTRVAFAGVAYDFVDGLGGINLIDIEVSQGLDVLDATQTGDVEQSRSDAETSFTKANASIMRLQKIAPKVSLLLDVSGQFTSDGLVASEEMAIGGGTYGRAFDPSEITGDRAVAARMELRYDGTVSSIIMNRYQLFVFADYGAVWNKVSGSYLREDLGSIGGGVRINFNRHLSAHFELALPYEKTDGYEERWGNSPRGFFGVNIRF